MSEWEAQQRLQYTYERRMRMALTTEMNRVAREAAEGYAASGAEGAKLCLPGHQKRLTVIFQGHYQSAMSAFALRTRAQLDSAKDAAGDLQRLINEWAQKVIGKKVQDVTKTTQKRIATAVKGVLEQSLSLSEAYRQINTALGGQSSYRARTIAITETHAASQAGSLVGAKSLGRPLMKHWISSDDDRTRDSHRDVAPVKIDESFNVAGSALSHPGDPLGPAREVVNCRCAMFFKRIA